MKPQYQHLLSNSFVLWFDHQILKKGEAYDNISSQFYPSTDTRYQGYYSYSSPFKQWIADSSISGVQIPTGITVNGVPKSLSTYSGYFDFENGRILSKLPITGVISGSYSVKNVNSYLSNEREEDIIFENRYINNSRFKKLPTGIAPYDPVLPACFIGLEMAENSPFALGGEDESMTTIKTVIICDDLYTLDGFLSICADSNKEYFSQIPFDKNPFNEFGDIKSGKYNYTGLAAQYPVSPFFIDKVRTSKISETLKNKVADSLFVGFADFTIKQYRYPRI